MKKPNMKKVFATLTITSLALAASLTYGLMSGHSTSAKSADSLFNMAPAASSSAVSAAAQTTTTGIIMPRTPVYALDTDNTLFILVPGTTNFVQLVRVPDGQVDGNLIGIDFRPADGNNNSVYAVTDTGKIYTISLRAGTLGRATLVSTMATSFPSGYQSLADFNPVVNALRLIGSDTLNYAVVNSGGSLNAMAIQTSLTYNPADVARGLSPRVSAGSYTNNVNGATATIFYGIDNHRDTLVTIDGPVGGSSATAGGVLRTIGNLVTPAGARIKVSPTADIDIYTLSNGANRLVGVSGRMFFTIDLATQATAAAALGTAKNVVTNGIAMNVDTGGRFNDVACALTTYEAENATQGGGNVVNTDNPGFTGTGFANFADNVANGFTEFQVNQAGPQTLIFRYANGSAVNRPCNITVNGTSVGTVAFPPTGAFTTYRTVTLNVNLPVNSAFKALRVTSTTAAGGPNLDSASLN